MPRRKPGPGLPAGAEGPPSSPHVAARFRPGGRRARRGRTAFAPRPVASGSPFAFQQELPAKVPWRRRPLSLIEIEVQNETNQTQVGLRFAAVPRIGEGLRLRQPDGFWASYDIIDVWYQKAEFGEIWMPYIH